MVEFVFAKQIAVYLLTEELTADGRVSDLFPISDIAEAEAGLQNE